MSWTIFFVLAVVSKLVAGSGVRFDPELVPSLPSAWTTRQHAEAICDQLEDAIQTAARATGQTTYLSAYQNRLREWHNKNLESMHAIRQGFTQEVPDRDAIKERIEDIWWGFGEDAFDIFNSESYFQNQVDRIYEGFLEGQNRLEAFLRADDVFFTERRNVHLKEIATQRSRQQQKADQVSKEDQAFLNTMVNAYRDMADYLRRVLDRNQGNDRRFSADVAMMMDDPEYNRLKSNYHRVANKIKGGQFKDTLSRGRLDYNWGLPFHMFSYRDAMAALYAQRISRDSGGSG